MTQGESLKCMSILAASYPRQALDEATLTTYATMLADLEFDAVQEAVKRIICTSKWFPSIAEIRAEVVSADTMHLPAPELAWGEVWKAIGRYGMNRKPEFSCPEIAAAVDAVSWRHICTDPNVTSTRARFTDAYRAIRESDTSSRQLGSHAPKQIEGRSREQHRLEYKQAASAFDSALAAVKEGK